jgi:riboflavin synthase
MFSGIVEEMGVVQEFERSRRSARATIIAKQILEDLSVGDSVAVNGVCLTAVANAATGFKVDISIETLEVTNLGALKVGDAVNLERAVRVGSRLGGHWVSGHSDGVGIIRDRKQEEDALLLTIEAPADVLRYCVKKGSVAVDGISLTINQMVRREFQVAVIPHTAKVTTLGLKGVGASVNLEADMIAKFVEKLLSENSSPQTVSESFLHKKGLL